MTIQAIIERTISAIGKLPREKAEEVLDFATLLLARTEEKAINEGLVKLSSSTEALDFLHEEEDIYSLADLKKPYHGDR